MRSLLGRIDFLCKVVATPTGLRLNKSCLAPRVAKAQPWAGIWERFQRIECNLLLLQKVYNHFRELLRLGIHCVVLLALKDKESSIWQRIHQGSNCLFQLW